MKIYIIIITFLVLQLSCIRKTETKEESQVYNSLDCEAVSQYYAKLPNYCEKIHYISETKNIRCLCDEIIILGDSLDYLPTFDYGMAGVLYHSDSLLNLDTQIWLQKLPCRYDPLVVASL
jgi:hypothetical protein